jgi:hypothetical protein
MSGTTIPAGGIATRAEEGTGRRLRRRHLWIIPGLAIALLANQLGNANGVGILALIAFGIAPDVPRLFGSRGRPVHALLHQPVAAIAALAVAAAGLATGLVPIFWLVGALVWVGHLVVGRGVNDVPRRATGR